MFTREQLFAIYAAEARGGAEAERVLREQRLVDANGNPIPARQAAYERALRRYAEADPAGWSAFLETLPP
ncbi:MAG: hypothetical protein D6731_05775 [Planctomycetota bacterium]|nr:MAG: hypothetical protein D6731_05775 [Planctomycetota bacterium]